MRKSMSENSDGIKILNLALQGGGSHGAFTWGVLDRLLEEERLVIEGVSGTSAGAMNAAVLAQGWEHGGRAGARNALDRFWHRVAEAALFSPFKRGPVDRLVNNWNLDRAPGTYMMDMLQHVASRYQTNPLGLNPLREVLEDIVNVKELQDYDGLK